jgi:hypothetical protein
VKAWKIEQEAAAPVATTGRKMPKPMGALELAQIGDSDDDTPF